MSVNLNAIINHCEDRVSRMGVLILEERARGRYANTEVIRRLSAVRDIWADERDRAIDRLVDEHQTDLENWSSRCYVRNHA